VLILTTKFINIYTYGPNVVLQNVKIGWYIHSPLCIREFP